MNPSRSPRFHATTWSFSTRRTAWSGASSGAASGNTSGTTSGTAVLPGQEEEEGRVLCRPNQSARARWSNASVRIARAGTIIRRMMFLRGGAPRIIGPEETTEHTEHTEKRQKRERESQSDDGEGFPCARRYSVFSVCSVASRRSQGRVRL